MKWLAVFVFSFYCSCNYAKVSKIVVWDSLYNNPNPIAMTYLQRALQITKPEYGNYKLIESAKMEQGRSLLELTKQNYAKLDLAVYAATAEREKQATAIRIPLLNGLMGYRICLINNKKQIIFDDVKSKQQLIDKNISFGLHQDWPDTAILRANGIPVKTTYKKILLFQQLTRGRFDCFSRGASEIYSEYLAYQTQGLVIENNLLIYYPLPLFFFVNKSRPILAERIQLGLQRLIASGEFERIFEQYFSPVIVKLKLSERAVIDLYNPTLSEKTVDALKIPTQIFRKKYLKNTNALPEILRKRALSEYKFKSIN